MENTALRRAGPRDYAFALSLYLESMAPYAAELITWNEDHQRSGFARQWRPADTYVITLGNRDVGWLQYKESPSEVFLQQFFVSPRFQRQGVGTATLRRLLAAWRDAGKSVGLTVLKNNPARRLYERL